MDVIGGETRERERTLHLSRREKVETTSYKKRADSDR